MFDLAHGTGLLVHLAAVLQVLGLLNRNQLHLRVLVLCGSIVYSFFYYVHPAEPLWGAIFWSTVLALANLYGIVRLILERTHFNQTDDEWQVMQLLQYVKPGEFRALMHLAEWKTTDRETRLTEQGLSVDNLYFVLSGKMTVNKDGRAFDFAPGVFIGEIAFLLDSPASATVLLHPGAKYIVWPADPLRKMIGKHPSLGTTMNKLLNRELAGKLATSMPSASAELPRQNRFWKPVSDW